MSIAGMVWTWQEKDRIHSRVTTNAGSERFLARLTALGMLEKIESIHAFFGDRAEGGSGYEILWKTNVDWQDLQSTLPKL